MNSILDNEDEQEERVNLKDKTALIYDNGLFLELGIRLAKDFKRILYFTPWKSAFPKTNTMIIGKGFDEIERIDNFWDHVDEADIIIFPDVYDGDLQVKLREMGYRVWGSGKGEEMELYRWETKEYFKKIGLAVQPVARIVGLDELREHLKVNENKFIKTSVTRGDFETFHHKTFSLTEPLLDDMEHRMGPSKYDYEFVVEDAIDGDDIVETGSDFYTIDGQFPSKIVTGFEIKDRAYIANVKDYKDVSPLITSVNDKLAETLKDYKYRGFMSTEIRVGKDKVPYFIDPCCFSDDTEVLTDSGWKLFKDCVIEDKFATMDMSNKNIEYQHASDYIAYHHKGKMVHMSNRRKTFDSLITPNHDVLRYDRNKKNLFKEKADSLKDKGFIPRSGNWISESAEDFFEIPDYTKKWDFIGQYGHLICEKVKHEAAVKINMKDWAAFMGWYLSEGSTCKYNVNISQTTRVDQLESVLKRLPFEYRKEATGFRISSIQLVTYLDQYGLCDKKFVPDYIKKSSSEVIRIFLDNFNLGDGSIHKGNKVYFTTSKTLADDIQECIFKVGSVANINIKPTKGTIVTINGKSYKRNHDTLILYERNDFKDYWFETQARKNLYINEVDYDAMVYCLTVPNGSLYVRRNGRPTWSGNCRNGSPPNELYQNMLDNLGEIIWYGADGIMVDPEFNSKYGVELLIHSDWANDHWQAVDFPEEIREHVKLRNACKIRGRYYIAPQGDGMPEIGAVVATGNTLEEAIEKIKMYASQIQGHRIDIDLSGLDKGLEETKKGEALGIKF